MPKVGAGRYIAPVMKIFPAFRKDYAHFERIVRSPPDSELLCTPSAPHLLTSPLAAVLHVFQAISIHETRATYHEQVAQQQPDVTSQVFKQMWFVGNHGNMAQDNGHSGWADAPLAWMIGQLHHHLRLPFDEGKLHKRFPSYPASSNLAGFNIPSSPAEAPSASTNSSSETQAIGAVPTGRLPPWINDDVMAAGAFKTFCHGWNQRAPGRYGERTFEEVHVTVRLRRFGRNRGDASMIAGYHLVPDGGQWFWRRLPQERARARNLLWINGDTKPAAMPFIKEGTLLPLEAALLGLSWCLNA